MAVGGGPAVAGNVLEHRQDAALSSSPAAIAPRDRRDLARFGAIGPVADDRVGAGNRHVRERQAIDVDAEMREIGRDQPRA